MSIRTSSARRLAERIAQARESRPFGAYLDARDHVLAMLDNAPAERPSGYRSDALAAVEYLLDPSPLVVERLRRHCCHLTGVWPGQYGSNRDRSRAQHQAKLRALLELGSAELFAPEPPELGGFGFQLDEGLANVDTLRSFESMVALDRAEILPALRREGERPVIWEVGAGWGGFAYAFKTVLPDVTYVISDLPELFLLSATYLTTVFPGARVTFHDGSSEHIAEAAWSESDFVFVPAFALEAVAPPRLDLTIDVTSFQEMATEEVEAYARHARGLETTFLYSLNREGSPANPGLESATGVLERHFWLREVDVLPVDHTTLPDVIPRASRKEKKAIRKFGPPSKPELDDRYRHVVGWRRLLT